MASCLLGVIAWHPKMPTALTIFGMQIVLRRHSRLRAFWPRKSGRRGSPADTHSRPLDFETRVPTRRGEHVGCRANAWHLRLLDQGGKIRREGIPPRRKQVLVESYLALRLRKMHHRADFAGLPPYLVTGQSGGEGILGWYAGCNVRIISIGRQAEKPSSSWDDLPQSGRPVRVLEEIANQYTRFFGGIEDTSFESGCKRTRL